MVFLLTCKNEEDPIKSVSVRVINIIHRHFRRSGAAEFVIGDGMWPKYELIQAFMVVLFTCKNEEDSFKAEGTEGHKISQGDFFQTLKGS